MLKRFDYHSAAAQVKSLSFLGWILLLLIYLSIFLHGKTPTLSDLILIFSFFIIGVGVSIAAYIYLKKTYIEISNEGILYSGWGKRIFSPWQSIREIKILGRKHKIFTDHGNFSIGYLQLADLERQSYFGLLKTGGKYSEELIEEVKKMAPHAKITYSIFLRPL